jgi:vacuolar protein sorting-associated protein 54
MDHHQTFETAQKPAASRMSSQDDSKAAGASEEALTDRERALKEAQEVTDSLETSLDGFNLLGVVANPRGGSLSSAHSIHGPISSPNPAASSGPGGSSSSGARRPTSHRSTASAPSATHGRASSYDFAADSLHLLEHTLQSVTEQIDAINVVFDSWSRRYLGNIYEDYEEYIPPTEVIGMLEELPAEMENLKLNTVQEYLQQSGQLSHQFHQRSRSKETWHWGESISPDEPLGGADGGQMIEEDDMAELDATIPPKFFQTYFDLTDSNTFQELLVGTEEDEEGSDTAAAAAPLQPAEDLSHLPDALSMPTRNLLRLPPPDHFTGLLDKVELALLKQVRSRSTAFFHETNRFGQLKEWIASLVQEVQRVRSLLDHVQEKSVVAWELIPLLDKQRKDLQVLRNVLEGANEVLRCKASIGGLLSANDDQSAAEQIQYGRKLLDGTLEEEGAFELGRLQALSTVGHQLSQYESLVVANLGDELVEIFLGWNSTTNFKTSEVQPRVQQIVGSLKLCKSLQKTGQLYVSRLNDVIRVTVRTTVGEFADEADASVKVGVTSMTLERFLDCLDMLFEQLTTLLKSAVGVDEFCSEENIYFRDDDTSKKDGDKSATAEAVSSAAELSSKSISELLRLRKEAHTLVTLNEMKRLWDVCIAFTLQLEKLSQYKATGLRSTLLSQAKAFIEEKHDANMSSLAAALDSERWAQCDVSRWA